MHVNRIGVRRHRRRHLALHRLQCWRGFGRSQVVEHLVDAGQQAAAFIKGGEGISKRRRGSVGGNGINLATMRIECKYKCWREVFGFGCDEWRQTVRVVPSVE